MEEIRNTCNIVVGKSEGKRPLGRHRNRWRVILEKILWE
jgi:hypothetical protein